MRREGSVRRGRLIKHLHYVTAARVHEACVTGVCEICMKTWVKGGNDMMKVRLAWGACLERMRYKLVSRDKCREV